MALLIEPGSRSSGDIAEASTRDVNGSFGIAAGLLCCLKHLCVVGLFEAFPVCLKLVPARAEALSQPLDACACLLMLRGLPFEGAVRGIETG